MFDWVETEFDLSPYHWWTLVPDLVYKLLHTRLQAPHFKLDRDKFVGAHDGILAVDPSFLQEASVSLLWLEIPQVLQGHETPQKHE